MVKVILAYISLSGFIGLNDCIMSDFEVMFEAVKNLFNLLKSKQLDEKTKNKVLSRLFALQKEVKEIQFIFDLL